MNEVSYQEINAEEQGQRLDNYLIRILKGVPKSHIYRIIRSGEVRINKKRAQINTRLETGDIVRIPPVRMAEKKELFVGSDLKKRLLDSIVHEDNQFLVINKPAGIAVHGGSGLSLGVIEALRIARDDLHYLELIHRLDKDTSGILLLAKKRSALRAVHALLEKRQIEKIYWALLLHPWEGKKSLTVNQALEKNTLKSGERIVSASDEGKASETHFKLLDNFQEACLVEARPKTGRTHQIRVHSAYLDHVIVGDYKYGFKESELPTLTKKQIRLYLHAREIRFNLNGIDYKFQAELDEKFQTTLNQLRTRSVKKNA